MLQKTKLLTTKQAAFSLPLSKGDVRDWFSPSHLVDHQQNDVPF
jgi:hypothetical protein